MVAKENERRQASALLERKMAAMEAVLAARRTPMVQPEPDTVMPPSVLPPSMVSYLHTAGHFLKGLCPQ